MNQNFHANREHVLEFDQILYQLAAYDVTGGYICVPKNEEELLNLNSRVIKKFNYFKALIKTGESTFEEIEQDILFKSGPFSKTVYEQFQQAKYLNQSKNDNVKMIDPKAVKIVNTGSKTISKTINQKKDEDKIADAFLLIIKKALESPKKSKTQSTKTDIFTKSTKKSKNKKNL